MNRTIIATLIAYHTNREHTAEPTQLIFRPRAMGKTMEYRQALGRGVRHDYGMRSGVDGLLIYAKNPASRVNAKSWGEAYQTLGHSHARVIDIDKGWLWGDINPKREAWRGLTAALGGYGSVEGRILAQVDAIHRSREQELCAETMARLWQQQFNELVSKGESGLVVSQVHDELVFSGADVSGWPQDRTAYADFIMDKDGVMTMVNCRYSKD